MRRSLLSISQTADPNELFATNFNNLDGLTLNTANGTVTSSDIIGTVTPNTSKALTITHTSGGSVTASVDLGSAYDELYVQYYVSVIKPISATSYTNNFEVGSAVEANHAAQILMSHSAGSWSIFSQDGTGFHNLLKVTNSGSWNKIGMYFSGTTVEYFINGTSIGTFNTFSQDRRYITLGGTGNSQVGYKVQYASLTVNTANFQDIITNSSTTGDYNSEFTSHYVDYSNLTNTAYDDGNGVVDLTAIDTSGWTGLHSRPYDPDGGTNYIDGACNYLYDLSVSPLSAFGLKTDKFFAKRGVEHKMESLTRPHRINLGATGYSSTIFNSLNAYGTGNLPRLDLSITANSADWTVFDAPNSVYRIAITTSNNCNGVWVGNEIGLRQVTIQSNMNSQSGCWYSDTTHVYARLYDDSDPSLQEISIGSNQNFSITPFGKVDNIDFRHSLVLGSDDVHMDNVEFGFGASVQSGWRLSNFRLYDGWGGTDYYLTETLNPGAGLGNSGLGGGLGVRAGAIIYNGTIENAYASISITTDADDAIVAFVEAKNTIVNKISILEGSGDGNPLLPVRLCNLTGFQAPRGIDDDPYPLSRDQPGHLFVVQGITFQSYFEWFNNMCLLHYDTVNTAPSVMNIMSFTAQGLANSHGKLGYNKYYITPTSDSPAVIFNQGAGNDIALWRTTLAAAGDFTDIDGVSDPDTTSTVETTLPVTTATPLAGKWGATDGTPIATGGGFDYSAEYIALGITETLSGDPITSTLNIGAY